MTDTDKPVSYQPTDGLTLRPRGRRATGTRRRSQKEITRVFEICHGCRMCFKYCDSFPILFDLIDKKHDGDVRKITAGETDAGHGRLLPVQAVRGAVPVHAARRARVPARLPQAGPPLQGAARRKQKGVPLRDRVLADPDAPARLARAQPRHGQRHEPGAAAPLVHGEAARHPPRQAAARLRRDHLRALGRAAGPDPGPAEGGEAVLFQTCYVQNNEPQIGRDTLEVLRPEPGRRPPASRACSAAACRPGSAATSSRCASRPPTTSTS